jgi:hypothetical protein
MRNKTKNTSTKEVDKIKDLHTLTLKREKLKQQLELVDYGIADLQPIQLDNTEILKLRKKSAYTQAGLVISLLIIALLLSYRKPKTRNPIGFVK